MDDVTDIKVKRRHFNKAWLLLIVVQSAFILNHVFFFFCVCYQEEWNGTWNIFKQLQFIYWKFCYLIPCSRILLEKLKSLSYSRNSPCCMILRSFGVTGHSVHCNCERCWMRYLHYSSCSEQFKVCTLQLVCVVRFYYLFMQCRIYSGWNELSEHWNVAIFSQIFPVPFFICGEAL